jgi:hypothetical protein
MSTAQTTLAPKLARRLYKALLARASERGQATSLQRLKAKKDFGHYNIIASPP